MAMFATCPAYRASPLILVDVAGREMWLKDESQRMGVGSFKALGGGYAVASLIAQRCGCGGLPIHPSLEFRRIAGEMTFVCASAGNHALGVAAGAQMFGAKVRVFLAETVDPSFVSRLRERGAEVVIAGATYEASVAAAMAHVSHCNEADTILLQDSTWPGRMKEGALVMEGYTVMGEELRQEFERSGDWPGSVYVQAGVGGLAAALTWSIRRSWPRQPKIIVVEPEAAACLGASHRAGRAVIVNGQASTMKRLDCKEPSVLALEILKRGDVEYMTVSDQEASEAVQVLRERGLCTTLSGAAGVAAIRRRRDGYGERALAIISEGEV